MFEKMNLRTAINWTMDHTLWIYACMHIDHIPFLQNLGVVSLVSPILHPTHRSWSGSESTSKVRFWSEKYSQKID